MKLSTLGPLLASAFACGSSQPPRGPAHTPADSPEAPTACPKQRSAAHEAREAALGSSGSELRTAAARAVLKAGRCEAAALSSLSTADGEVEEVVLSLLELREQSDRAQALFREVANYEVGAFAFLALDSSASALEVFADRVLEARPTGPGTQDARAELEAAALELRHRASLRSGQAAAKWEELDAEEQGQACAEPEPPPLCASILP